MSHDSDDAGDTEAVASPDSDRATVRHSWTEGEQPSVTIVEAVSAATGRRTTELPSLWEGTDPDAVDALLTRENASRIRISFNYAGTVVVARGDGTIEVRATDPAVDGK